MEKEKTKNIHYKKYVFLLIFILIISSFFGYSRYYSTKGLVIKEYKITNNSLPTSFHGFKIAHLSDIHYGRIIKKNELENIIEKLNLLKPDLVVITGDLLDDTTDINNEELVETLKKINANVGKYAIKGNHDMAHREWESIIKESNFVILNDTYELIYNNGYDPIMLAGISTNLAGMEDTNKKIENITNYLNTFKGNDASKTKEEIEALKSNEPKYKILIMHEPDFINNIDYSEYNLILAGHSHNGQIRLPFIGALYTPNGAKEYYDEYYNLNNTNLYISSGLGTSTINFRFFNKPSFNFYRLTTK